MTVLTVLTVAQGHKVDNVIKKAMKYNWSIQETQSMIEELYD